MVVIVAVAAAAAAVELVAVVVVVVVVITVAPNEAHKSMFLIQSLTEPLIKIINQCFLSNP